MRHLKWLLFTGLGGWLIFGYLATALAQQDAVVVRAVTWLVTTHQNSDGGYSDFSAGANQGASGVSGTLDVILALVSAEYRVDEPVFGQSASPLDFLRQQTEALEAYASLDGGSAGKVALALTAAGEDPRAFGGVDYVLKVTQQLSPTGQYNTTTAFNQSLALLGLQAAGETPDPAAVTWLIDQQATEGETAGSWDDGFGTLGNTDATAMAVMALLGAGPAGADAAAAGVAYLQSSQLEDGLWAYGPGLPGSVNSTALALQALQAAGVDVDAADSPLAREGQSPRAVLRAQQAESGAFQVDFGSGLTDDFFTTVQAIPALAGRTLPLSPQPDPTPMPTAEPTTAATPVPTPVPAAVEEASDSGRLFIGAVIALVVLAGVIVWVGRRLGQA